MRRDLLQFKQTTGKPVVTSILDTGAGGAYYLATASDAIYAHPTSVVGGVGVIINIYNMSDTLEQQNIEPTPVRSGEHIDLGSPAFKLSKDGRGLLEEIANEFHGRFKDAVTYYRPNVPAKDLDGRVFTASYAKEHGFIDDVIYFDEAICEAKMLAGLGMHDRVVMFRRDNDRALTEFDITPNTPASVASIPISIPGLDRAKLPHFLYLWQPESSLESHAY
jgi:protease-4